MDDISYRAERYWSRQTHTFLFTGFAYDSVGRILVSCGPYKSRAAAFEAIRDLTAAKYGVAA